MTACEFSRALGGLSATSAVYGNSSGEYFTLAADGIASEVVLVEPMDSQTLTKRFRRIVV
jgi:hypothetical protein